MNESISVEYVRTMLEAFAQGAAEVIGNHSEGKYRWQKVDDLRQLLRLMERGYKLRDARKREPAVTLCTSGVHDSANAGEHMEHLDSGQSIATTE